MTVQGMHREASIEINASPEAIYDLISDLPRMGEWSPENIGGEWQGGGSGTVGDRFIGHKQRYSHSISASPKRTLATIRPTGPLRSICWVTATTRTLCRHHAVRRVMPSCCRRASRSSFHTTTVVMVSAPIARWRRAKAGRRRLCPHSTSSNHWTAVRSSPWWMSQRVSSAF